MWITRSRQVEDIATELLTKGAAGGGTIAARVGQQIPGQGYVVGQRGISGHLHYFEVLDWVRRELPAVLSQGHYFGAWVDSETGVTYLDVVRVFSELVPACRDAEQRGELAIWDLGGQREIRAAEYVTAPSTPL